MNNCRSVSRLSRHMSLPNCQRCVQHYQPHFTPHLVIFFAPSPVIYRLCSRNCANNFLSGVCEVYIGLRAGTGLNFGVPPAGGRSVGWSVADICHVRGQRLLSVVCRLSSVSSAICHGSPVRRLCSVCRHCRRLAVSDIAADGGHNSQAAHAALFNDQLFPEPPRRPGSPGEVCLCADPAAVAGRRLSWRLPTRPPSRQT